MSAQVAAVLDAARDLIDVDGHRQGIRPPSAKDDDRRRDVLVAIAQADLDHGGPSWFMAAVRAFNETIGWRSVGAWTDGPGGWVADWNDADGRRVSEVQAVFTVAAGRERDAA